MHSIPHHIKPLALPRNQTAGNIVNVGVAVFHQHVGRIPAASPHATEAVDQSRFVLGEQSQLNRDAVMSDSQIGEVQTSLLEFSLGTNIQYKNLPT